MGGRYIHRTKQFSVLNVFMSAALVSGHSYDYVQRFKRWNKCELSNDRLPLDYLT